MGPILHERLANPRRVVSLIELAETWFAARIEATMPGYGALVDNLDMLRKIRGALGQVLTRSASRQALAGQACPWQPPCALDVLFREQLRLDGHIGLPKPWVIAADRKRHDLVIRVTLLGLASDWVPAIGAALAEALVHGVRWDTIEPGEFRPKPEVAQLRVREVAGVKLGHASPTAEIRLLTPLDAESVDLRDTPEAFLPRMARRVAMLARWQDADADAALRDIAIELSGLDFDTSNLERKAMPRRAGGGIHNFAQSMHVGSMQIIGVPEHVWPLLRLGELCHVGRSATFGFGSIGIVGKP